MEYRNRDTSNNFATFRDCLSDPVIRKLAAKPQKVQKKKKASRRKSDTPTEVAGVSEDGNDAEDLAEFIDYIAAEIFDSLPLDLRELSYSAVQDDPSLNDKYCDPLPKATTDEIFEPLPVSVSESLVTYGVIPDEDLVSVTNLLVPVFLAFISAATSAPPVWSTTRPDACEICARDWVPLSYHHLIPRSTHEKVLKRGWHDEWMLNSVAWLCGPCHRFVHSCAPNEELAQQWYTVEKLKTREDVQKWATWVGRMRYRRIRSDERKDH